MILLIDNYDSFTWNLADLIRRFDSDVRVFRNDEIDLEAVQVLSPDGIVISPGPGRPESSGVSVDIVTAMMGKVPILGVCLGHQLLGEKVGLELQYGAAPVHGKTSPLQHDGRGIFAGLPQEIQVMRYHSLVLSNTTLTPGVEITARTANGEVMGIRHKFLNFEGLQFHPESVLTACGDRMISNWIAAVHENIQQAVYSNAQAIDQAYSRTGEHGHHY